MQRVNERKDDMTISEEFSLMRENSLPTFTKQDIFSPDVLLYEGVETPLREESSASPPFLKKNGEKKDKEGDRLCPDCERTSPRKKDMTTTGSEQKVFYRIITEESFHESGMLDIKRADKRRIVMKRSDEFT
jgi:hypothetical protein